MNCGRLAGMRVSELFCKLRADSGVVAGMFFTIVSMSASPSPLLAQSIPSVELPSLTAPQMHGAMSTAYVGQLQMSDVRVDVDTTVPSVHLAAVAPDPN